MEQPRLPVLKTLNYRQFLSTQEESERSAEYQSFGLDHTQTLELTHEFIAFIEQVFVQRQKLCSNYLDFFAKIHDQSLVVIPASLLETLSKQNEWTSSVEEASRQRLVSQRNIAAFQKVWRRLHSQLTTQEKPNTTLKATAFVLVGCTQKMIGRSFESFCTEYIKMMDTKASFEQLNSATSFQPVVLTCGFNLS